MRKAILHIVAKALGVSIRIDGERYGAYRPTAASTDCGSTHLRVTD